jgi:hypothetical protein
MEGHYGRDGAEAPELFSKQELSQFAPRHVASEGAGESAGLSQLTAVHEVGNGAVGGEAPMGSSGVSSAASQYVVNSTTNGQNNVPLPPALLLLASGLFCLPTIRQRIKLPC